MQVIGCAYTYNISQKVRSRLARRKNHSSLNRDFSFFKKIERPSDIARGGESLRLNPNAKKHWYEPELAILLGENYQIIGFALANDLTAADIELGNSTYDGKCWPGSLGLSDEFVDMDVDDIDIGLKIEREGKIIYDHTYSTQRRRLEFPALPSKIIECHRKLVKAGMLDKSKDIDTSLPAGTVILAGTGLITPPKYYAQTGDIVTVFAENMRALVNQVAL
ncbi:MAG: fumarylacetoacetate hydrolase family protein [Patescibacteria group bacterium]|nr:hypothetical protein [Patescibacteria group bacterium]